MNIAFYATMKSPDHPVPSGDRLMARLLMQALGGIASTLRLASEFRAYTATPDDQVLAGKKQTAEAEADRLISEWNAEGWRPHVWFSYHPYYKAPDWIGPIVADYFSCPIVTVEASFSERRAQDDWAPWQAENVAGLRQAACHLYMTERDRIGLARLPGLQGELVHLPPFIDTTDFVGARNQAMSPEHVRLVTVAMMRPDVKLASYQFLAKALTHLQDCSWTLDIVGDGEARQQVETAFGPVGPDRVTWHGKLDQADVRRVLQQSDVFVWPGFGEAYGLAYLEAQASGLPVLAQRCAGVPEVVIDGETGRLVGENDLASYSEALRELLSDRDLIRRLGRQAREFVLSQRTLTAAQARISAALRGLAG
ncbi:MAG: glycosyltransferase family 4 protein [Hyphomicrobiaceae bacterium]